MTKNDSLEDAITELFRLSPEGTAAAASSDAVEILCRKHALDDDGRALVQTLAREMKGERLIARPAMDNATLYKAIEISQS